MGLFKKPSPELQAIDDAWKAATEELEADDTQANRNRVGELSTAHALQKAADKKHK